ncbi:hypothetical protein [Bradyrhizobium japonicum]|jgi:hypothetical protein|uniref:hypothetical protein n=1 Tax=Bradyrhizobium japonicum TaxID=375 RepID=UPI0004AE7E38|nr:hypothetical protein [Bradyrhizobium japonicum]MCD9105869.1 hypothetical protein [Bradyrhizobium japonicum]MCD9253429.1 hypothetical protein [Bradyrhizobium japonicum SEMIA 5079]MCD9818514.1 hypothetical protein [Bradyrhizobium japonicum]MCD9891495.1 hypothetical protein [Bradyrhizobium japonicum]MCD9907248.1 hypothetical protein [Bradyrhizobium japonicum]
MPSGDEDETAERDELLPFELLPFELRLFGLWLFELLLLELLAFVFFAPVAARAFLVGANLYPTLFRK